METNSVVLSLETYNRLRDFKNNVKAKNTFYAFRSLEDSGMFISTEDAVKEIIGLNAVLKAKLDIKTRFGKTAMERIKELVREGDELKAIILKLKNPDESVVHDPNEILKKVHEMSIWEFIKWRRK